jgi:F0F1-type ATP synthase assembly protein I
MKKQNKKVDFKLLLILGIIILVVGLASLSKNTDFGSAMIIGGFVLALISLLRLSKNKKIKKIIVSSWWFLVAGIIFGFAGIRYFVKADVIGGIINLLVSLLFFLAFIGHTVKKK